MIGIIRHEAFIDKNAHRRPNRLLSPVFVRVVIFFLFFFLQRLPVSLNYIPTMGDNIKCFRRLARLKDTLVKKLSAYAIKIGQMATRFLHVSLGCLNLFVCVCMYF